MSENAANYNGEFMVTAYERQYVPGVTFIARTAPVASASRKVGVYVDGLYTQMPEDMLERLIEIGFVVVVSRKP